MAASYRTQIGHVHLKVRDLDRAVAFYTRFFDLRVVERYGDHYVFLSGGELHHELALQNVGPGAPQPSPHSTGLYHVAFEVPDRRAFALAFQALTEAGVPVATVDHRISWAIYFEDPDGNGLEIYWDTRSEPTGAQGWQGRSLPLPAARVLAASTEESDAQPAP